MAADVAVDGSLRFLEHDRPQPVGAPPTYDVRVALDDGSGKLPASASLEVARLTVFLASLFALSVSCGWRRGGGGGRGGGYLCACCGGRLCCCVRCGCPLQHVTVFYCEDAAGRRIVVKVLPMGSTELWVYQTLRSNTRLRIVPVVKVLDSAIGEYNGGPVGAVCMLRLHSLTDAMREPRVLRRDFRVMVSVIAQLLEVCDMRSLLSRCCCDVRAPRLTLSVCVCLTRFVLLTHTLSLTLSCHCIPSALSMPVFTLNKVGPCYCLCAVSS